MTIGIIPAITTAAYIVAALMFILSLAGLSKHETSRSGLTYGIVGMGLALAATIALSLNHMQGLDDKWLPIGLLAGATLGGNLTPIGASANITALGILRKNGYEASTWAFMKISIPFTLTAVMTGYVAIWLIWR